MEFEECIQLNINVCLCSVFIVQDASLLCTYFAPCVACALRGALANCMSACRAHPSYTVVTEGIADPGGFIYVGVESVISFLIIVCMK